MGTLNTGNGKTEEELENKPKAKPDQSRSVTDWNLGMSDHLFTVEHVKFTKKNKQL